MTQPDATPSPAASFVSHRQVEFTLVADLKRLFAIASRLGLGELAAQIEDARSRIEQHRFSIAVVGEFKRGKSTFINALLGKEVLPSDIVPTSATVNRVTYGLKPSVKIVFKADAKGQVLEQFVEIEELADYVTKLTPEAEAMASTIDEAIVQYPVPFCKNNVDIIDTPGLSDDAAMTATTLAVLPRVDAAILVILATAPFAQTEADFLESLLVEYGLGSVLFVVTAIDRLREEKDRVRVLEAVRDRISERIHRHAAAHFNVGTKAYEDYLRRVGEPRVYGVSGYDALIGKSEHDEELLAASRFPEFETFLERFLTEESGLVALRTHLERIDDLVRTLHRELRSRRASPALQTAGPAAGSLDALLESLEWLVHDEKNRLETARRGAQEQLRPAFERLPGILQQVADDALAELTFEADDLEPHRLAACLDGVRGRLNEAFAAAAEQAATAACADLRSHGSQAVAGLLQLAAVFDRVSDHVRGVLAPLSEASQQPSPPESMTGRLLAGAFDSSAGFDRQATVAAALPALFDANVAQRQAEITELMRVPAGWAESITVRPMDSRGPKFAKKAVDLVRIEKFKSDVRGRFSEALSQTLQDLSSRQSALSQAVAASFASIERDLERALNEVRAQRHQLEADRQRRIARGEQEHQALEQFDTEIGAIRERAQQLGRQLD